MKPQGLACLLVLMLALPAVAAESAGSSVEPACVVGNETCKEPLEVGPFSFWYFRSYSLYSPSPDVTQAVIVTHGLERNAAEAFEAAVTGLGNAEDPSLLVIAPHFKGFVNGSATCNDETEPNELHWSCEGPPTSINRWDDGGRARDTGGVVIYSFDMIDRVLERLSDKALFPNLTKITIAGHSDGGQFTQRYAAGNQMDGTIEAAVKYVIANPGSYMYLDDTRLEKDATCFEDGTCTAEFTTDWDPESECLDTYNNYKYGLDNRTFGYMDASQPGFSDEELRIRFTSRTVAYVMGELDQKAGSVLDQSCPANAQGSHVAVNPEQGTEPVGGRRERGTIFWNYMSRRGAAHTLSIAPGCEHDPVCMYSSDEMVAAIRF